MCFCSCGVMSAEASPGGRVGQALRPLPGTFMLCIRHLEIEYGYTMYKVMIIIAECRSCTIPIPVNLPSPPPPPPSLPPSLPSSLLTSLPAFSLVAHQPQAPRPARLLHEQQSRRGDHPIPRPSPTRCPAAPSPGPAVGPNLSNIKMYIYIY